MTTLLLFLLLAPGDLGAAERALKENKPAQAIELLGDLADGDDPRANAVLGRAFYAMREYSSAVEPLLIASDGQPKDMGLARVAASACWGAARAGGQFARAFYADAIRMAKRVGSKTLLAPLHKEAGNFDKALELYRALDKTPATLQSIAECLDGLSRSDDAKQAYGAALEAAIAKKELRIAYRTAFRCDLGGRLVQWLNKEIEREPDNAWYRLYRGYSHANLQLDGKAVEDLRAGLKAVPNDANASDLFCRVLIRWGIKEQRPAAFLEMEPVARALLQGGHDIGRTHLLWLAGNAWLNRDVERSYSLLKELWGHDDKDKNAGLNFAAMGRRLGHLDEAEQVYRKLLESFVDDPDVLNDLGILLDGRGDRPGAVAAWKRVLLEDPEDMNAIENLFTAAWERGADDARQEYLRRGLAIAKEREGDLWVRWRWFRDRLGWAPAGHGCRGGQGR